MSASTSFMARSGDRLSTRTRLAVGPGWQRTPWPPGSCRHAARRHHAQIRPSGSTERISFAAVVPRQKHNRLPLAVWNTLIDPLGLLLHFTIRFVIATIQERLGAPILHKCELAAIRRCFRRNLSIGAEAFRDALV
jgi:hypothetical protein